MTLQLPKDDELTVQEIEELCQKVEQFIIARGSPPVNIMWLANLILKRLMNDRDYFVAVEGIRGGGKSNFILLLTLLQTRYSGLWQHPESGKIVKVLPRLKPLPNPWVHIKPGFSFKNNISFLDDADVVQQKFNSLSKYMGFIVDEGSQALHKFQWQSKLQFLLIKMSDTQRWQNKSVYVCFPNFKELNSTFRNDRIMMRVYLYDRNAKEHYASAIISLKTQNRYITDPWNNDENAKLYDQLLKRIPVALRTPKNVLYAEKKLAGYAGDFDVPSLEHIAPRIWDIYMQYKMYYAEKNQSQSAPTENAESAKVKKIKVNLFNAVTFVQERFPDMTKKEIAEAFKMPYAGFLKMYSEFIHSDNSIEDNNKTNIETT